MRLCIGGQGNGKAIPELPATLPNAVLSIVVNTYLAIPKMADVVDANQGLRR